jgi:hypothetical protein
MTVLGVVIGAKAAAVSWTDKATFWVLFAQLVVLIGAAFVAWRQVREARILREAQAQPFVVVDLAIEERDQSLRIIIENIGATIATNVRVSFEPQLESSLDTHGGGVVPPRDLKALKEGIPSLPPGKRIAIFLDMFQERTPGKFPDVYVASVSFYSPTLERSFQDESVLDLGIYRHVMFDMRHDIHDVHKQLKELAAELRKRS